MKLMNLDNSPKDIAFVVTDQDKNGLEYMGMTSPFGVTLNGERYIVKAEQFETSVYSEYIASRFINCLGIKAQDVYLGKYNGSIVAVMKDFVPSGFTFFPFEHDAQSSTQNVFVGSFYSFDDIDNIIQSFNIDNSIFIREVKDFFTDMFICDAIIGNSDRNTGNWGFLKGHNSYSIAPVYDNANSLISKASVESLNKFYEDRYGFVRSRSEKLPMSLVGMDIDGEFVRDFRKICNAIGETKFSKSLSTDKVAIAARYAVDGVPKIVADICKYILIYRYEYIVKGEDSDYAFRQAEMYSC